MADFSVEQQRFLDRCDEHREKALALFEKAMAASAFDSANVTLTFAQTVTAIQFQSAELFAVDAEKKKGVNPRADFDEDGSEDADASPPDPVDDL